MNTRTVFLLCLTTLIVTPAAAQCEYPTPVTPQSCQEAIDYHYANQGVSLLVWVDGEVVCEDYRPGGGPDVHNLAWSGTKSFWGVLAAAAAQDGDIALHELVSDTITEWQSDTRKSQITVHHLLTLTSGLQADVEGQACPTYADAIAVPALYDPGTHWEYGAVQYQCFGEFIRRKMESLYTDPLDYLEDRILDRISSSYGDWEYGSDGYPRLPQGSSWTAPEWIKFGEMVRLGGYWPPTSDQVVEQHIMDQCFHGTSLNNTYGVTWWLPAPGSTLKPCDSVMAMGAGSQRLYVMRSHKLVAVRQTAQIWHGWQFDDNVFIDKLLAPTNFQDTCPPGEAWNVQLERIGDDLRFTWDPVDHDITGNNDLLAGYNLWKATEPDFSNGQEFSSTSGALPGALAPGEGAAEDGIVFYQVRARDKCGNVGD